MSLRRLASALKLDFILQKRYGIIYASLFVTFFWIVILAIFPENLSKITVPIIIFVDLAIIGFFFVAGLLLFEKDEGTLSAIIITPLRFKEYIVSKLISLTVISIIVSFIVVFSVYRVSFNPLLLIIGVSFTSFIFIIVGFIAVAPFDSISRFLLPSQLYVLPLQLPLLTYLGYKSILFYLIPSYGSLLLIRAAFNVISGFEILFAIASQILWIYILFNIGAKFFDKYLVGREGGH